MTNFEAYKDDILKIDGDIAFDKVQRKVVRCHKCNCKDCEFNEKCFENDKIKWLYKDYEPPVSDDEIDFIKALNKLTRKKYKYIARDTEGIIRFFETKPKRNEIKNYYDLENGYVYIGVPFKVLFPNIKFKDGLYDIENKTFIK